MLFLDLSQDRFQPLMRCAPNSILFLDFANESLQVLATFMTWIRAAIILMVLPAISFADDVPATIRQEAQKCAKALLNADYDGVVKYTHRRVVKATGGKEAMLVVLKRGLEEMQAKGITIQEVTIGEADKPLDVESWTVAFVPQRLILKTTEGKIEQDSHLLGISEDDGKTWVFVDCSSLTKEKVAQIFPELAGRIELPAKKKPVVIKSDK